MSSRCSHVMVRGQSTGSKLARFEQTDINNVITDRPPGAPYEPTPLIHSTNPFLHDAFLICATLGWSEHVLTSIHLDFTFFTIEYTSQQTVARDLISDHQRSFTCPRTSRLHQDSHYTLNSKLQKNRHRHLPIPVEIYIISRSAVQVDSLPTFTTSRV